MREAYADALAAIEDFDTAMLTPGRIAPVLGRRVLPLDGFEAALGNPEDKRRMWHYLQRLKPAAAPSAGTPARILREPRHLSCQL